MVFPYIDSNRDLVASVAAYWDQMDSLDSYSPEVAEDAVKLLPRYNVWIAIAAAKGRYIVAPSKFAGYKGLDLALYKKHRSEPEGSPERLNGSEADRHIRNLGGSDLEVGKNDHPAIQAVRDFCNRFGKSVKSTARVRIFDALTVHDANAESESRSDSASSEHPDKSTRVRGLTIAEAKQGLAAHLGCKASDIEITIRA